MKRSLFVVAVLVLAALTATAPAASAQNVSGSLEVASKNTTDSDFQSATLTNMSISGSADSASVELSERPTSFTEFETQGGGQDIFTGTGGLQTEFSLGKVDGEVDNVTITVDRYFDNGARNDVDWYLVKESPDGTYGEGTLIAENYQPTSEGEHTINVPDGFVADDEVVTLEVIDRTTSTGQDTGRILVDTTDEPDRGSVDGSLVDHAGDVVAKVKDQGLYSSGEYIGAEHAASQPREAFVNLTLQNASATITVQENTSGTWSDINQATVSTTQNHTVDISPATGSELRTVVEFNAGSGATVAELHDEGILFDAAAPSIDTASASPTGDLQQANQTLSLNVSDADLGLAQGDSVNVTFEAKAPDESSFSAVGSETLTANGTANTSLTADVGGTWEWRATATDSYGESVTSQTFTLSVPATLEIRNETEPNELIDSANASATVTFFGTETVVSRPVNNGTVDLSGLPADEEFVAVIDADGHFSRRIVIPSIYEQETAYLLAENETAANIVFKLDDSTGNFDPEETTLFVEKAITRNNSTEYRVVTADEFGASGEFAVDLLDDTRYRLRVMNAQGDQRVLGSYTTSGDALATVPIGDVAIGDNYDGGAAVQTNLVESGGYQYVKVTYVDSENATDTLELGVELENGTVVRPNTTETVSGDVYSETINVSQYPDDTTYRVYYSADRDGETLSGTDTLNGVSSPLAGVPLDPQAASIGSWVGILAVGGLIGIASGPFGALAMVVTATFFTLLGTVGIPSLLLTIAGAVAILARIGDR